ncbi:MAG TPA: thioredoxin family protein [Blastocatellia bacterium]|nr:thioredoxin family protein [Blastocatellia bacterium]
MISYRVALFVLTAITAVASPVGAQSKAPSVSWTRGYSEGLKAAQQSGKPVLLDFNARWCGPCRAMDEEVWPARAVAERAERFVCVSVDIDNNEGLAQRYRADSIPLIVLADPFGNQLSRHVGYMSVAELSDWLEGFPADFSEVVEALAVSDKDPNEVQAAVNVGDFYARMGVADMSRKYYDRALKSPAIQGDMAKREQILLTMGRTYLKAGDLNAARKTFERCLKECPAGNQCDLAMLGVMTAELRQGKTEDAAKILAEMKARYPNSEATVQAEKNLQAVRSGKP